MRIIDRDVHFFLVLISLQKIKKNPEDTIGNRHPLLRIALFVLVFSPTYCEWLQRSRSNDDSVLYRTRPDALPSISTIGGITLVFSVL